jgi:hypothetical protein
VSLNSRDCGSSADTFSDCHSTTGVLAAPLLFVIYISISISMRFYILIEILG